MGRLCWYLVWLKCALIVSCTGPSSLVENWPAYQKLAARQAKLQQINWHNRPLRLLVYYAPAGMEGEFNHRLATSLLTSLSQTAKLVIINEERLADKISQAELLKKYQAYLDHIDLLLTLEITSPTPQNKPSEPLVESCANGEITGRLNFLLLPELDTVNSIAWQMRLNPALGCGGLAEISNPADKLAAYLTPAVGSLLKPKILVRQQYSKAGDLLLKVSAGIDQNLARGQRLKIYRQSTALQQQGSSSVITVVQNEVAEAIVTNMISDQTSIVRVIGDKKIMLGDILTPQD